MLQDSIAESLTEPTVLVIFGASGDLTRRKVIPALYNLFLDHWLPQQCRIIGFARTSVSRDDYVAQLRSGVDQFSREAAPMTFTGENFPPCWNMWRLIMRMKRRINPCSRQ